MSKESLGGTRRSFVSGAAASVAAAATLSPARDAAAGPPAISGEWSGRFGWPCVAIHMSLLPDLTPNPKILTWADDDGNYPPDRLADFSRAFVVTIPNNQEVLTSVVEIDNHLTNLFCSGHAYLPDGRLLVVGGHETLQYYGSADVTIFEHANNEYTWKRQNNSPMNGGRWYATAVTMGNGEVVVVSGTERGKDDYNPLPQVWETNAGGGWRDLDDARLSLRYYPTLFAAPDGRVFQSGSEQRTRFLDTTFTAGRRGRWTDGPRRTFGDRFYGGAAMYDNAEILMTGGGSPPTATAEVINLGESNPTWRRTGSMHWPRRHMNLTILADGTVLATHGSSARNNDARGAVLAAEIWDKVSGEWAVMASASVKRLYHSSAVLLPDGRVLCAGGGRPSPAYGIDNQNAEIFSPPYLFKGPRPVIGDAPEAVGYGQTFRVSTPDADDIDVVRAIRLSSVTHTNNMNQRAKRLAFDRGAGRLSCRAPTSPNTCPPGHYLLFILRGGVPSIAKCIRIG